MGTDISKRIIANFVYESNIIEAIFTNNGEIITVVNKKTA